MRKTMLAALAGLILVCSAPRAEAKLFEVWGSGLIGGGWGTGNTHKDFYKYASGGAGGVEAGIKILFIGVFVDYLRWFGGNAGANLLSFNLGGDYTLDFGKLSLVFRLAGAYYYGTLPNDTTITIDNIPVTQVNTRGIGVHGGVGLRYTFLKVLSVGCTPDFGYHYFFGGASDSILSENSSGFDLNVLAYLRVGFGF
jgi:hypothetical protein